MTSRSDSYLKSSTGRAPDAGPGIFLTAEWKWLVVVNYLCGPELLKAWLPACTCFPFHRNFEEISAITDQDGKEIVKGCEEEFIIEQFWDT